jgi:hypothetical protein
MFCLFTLVGCSVFGQGQYYGARVDLRNACDYFVQIVAYPIHRIRFSASNLNSGSVGVAFLSLSEDALVSGRGEKAQPNLEDWFDYRLEIRANGNTRSLDKEQLQEELKHAKHTRDLCDESGNDCRVHFWTIDNPALCPGPSRD